jgi:hypothetical protein
MGLSAFNRRRRELAREAEKDTPPATDAPKSDASGLNGAIDDEDDDRILTRDEYIALLEKNGIGAA